MIIIKGLIWDDWNKTHIAEHGITVEEVEEVCHGSYRVTESYRKRILVVDTTIKQRRLAIPLSPEDRNLVSYPEGIYYPITAFDYDEEVTK